ncbi:MAG: efflux RND transporter permease subunit [Bacteroidota bacterium]
MNIPGLSIKNFPFTLLTYTFVFLLGLNTFLNMPRMEDPELDLPNIFVVAVYPGASPEDIESQVAEPIEEAVNELDDIEAIETRISDGLVTVEVKFNFGIDGGDKKKEVQDKVNEVESDLPEGIFSLDVREISTSTVSIMQLALVSETAPYLKMKKEAERIKDVIEKVDGVKKVLIQAYPEQEVRIALNPSTMSQMGISLSDVENAIKSNNANIPGGAIKVSNKLFNVKSSGDYENLEQIRNTVVGSYNGKIIYLKNIASIFMDYEDERHIARLNGQRSLAIAIQQKSGRNIFKTIEPIQKKMAALSIAEDMDLEVVFDQSVGVKDRVSGFISNLVQGIVLVGIIILLALGLRAAGLVMLSIPLSILVGLFVVDLYDLGLQQMSIAGLVVALGLLVDNSIAITENIERFLAEGYSREDAAIKGTNQLVTPITSATITTMLAFVPVLLVPGTTVGFIKALPITVVATMAASFVISITLTPFLASRFLRPPADRKRQPILKSGLQTIVTGPYRRLLGWALNHKLITLILAVGSFVGALSLFPLVGVSFFPKAEKPQIRITVELPKGSNIDATNEVMLYVESVLESRPEINKYAANVGKGNPRIYYNTNQKDFTANFGEVYVTLHQYEIDEFYNLLDALRERFQDFPDARISVIEYEQGPPVNAPIEVMVNGENLDELKRISSEIEDLLEAHPQTLNINNLLGQSRTDIEFKINRDKALMLGVPIINIDRAIRSYVNGQRVGTFRDKDAEDYGIVMRYGFEEEFRISDFDKIQVEAVTGRSVPLKQLSHMTFSKSPSQIFHKDTERVSYVLADLKKGANLDAIIADITPKIDGLDWDEGFGYTYLGELESRQKSFGNLGIASLLALLLIFGVLILQFKSLAQPLIIFSALPLAVIGSILMLYVNGVSFSFTAFIGLTSLIGIAINNSIVLVDFANKEIADGATVAAAVRKAGEVRFTPIVLTTITTVLGLLPLTLTGGSLWAPMGWTIIGGLMTSTFFVLLVVPILYELFTRKTAEKAVA